MRAVLSEVYYCTHVFPHTMFAAQEGLEKSPHKVPVASLKKLDEKLPCSPGVLLPTSGLWPQFLGRA
jgi:hypothetical protein